MGERAQSMVEVTADLEKRVLVSRFSGFIKLEDAMKAKKLYAESVSKFNGQPYTALTYFNELKILAPEAVDVFASMVEEASNHRCLRSARVIDEKQTIARMQLERIDSETKNYDARFFHSEADALRYLQETEN